MYIFFIGFFIIFYSGLELMGEVFFGMIDIYGLLEIVDSFELVFGLGCSFIYGMEILVVWKLGINSRMRVFIR